MIIILSPAKNINEDVVLNFDIQTNTRFDDATNNLLYELKKYSATDLQTLMKISNNLAQLNFLRYQQMQIPLQQHQKSPALLAFNGAVFQSLKATDFTDEEMMFAQNKLRILSGFYGLLRPFDGILPYRLEMGTKLKVGSSINLYQFWGDKINELLQNDIDDNGDNVLINLASNEYFKAVKFKNLNARIITPSFKEYRNGEYKMITIYAKMARGLMSRFIIRNEITTPDELKLFDYDNYQYNPQLSVGDNWVFTR